VIVLFETFDGSAVIAGDAQRPIGHDALGIDHVAERFLDAPFTGSVTEVAILFAPAREKGDSLGKLAGESGNHVVAGDQRNVAVVVRVVLAGLRSLEVGRHGSPAVLVRFRAAILDVSKVQRSQGMKTIRERSLEFMMKCLLSQWHCSRTRGPLTRSTFASRRSG